MKDKQEVYQGIQDILATMEEVLEHIHTQLDELRLEESFKLLIDFTEGIRSVEETINKIVHSNASGDNLKQSLNVALEAYEASDVIQIKETVQNQLLPNFATWKQEVEKSIQQ